MLETFKKNISINQFLEHSKEFEINRVSDLISYVEFINYFKNLNLIDKHNLIIGINFTYGWMPTIFEFKNYEFQDAISVLNKVKLSEGITDKEIYFLINMFNNSLVGTSKLLHFINPEKYAIWDSRVYRYLFLNKEPNYKTISNVNIYLSYIEFCKFISNSNEFTTIHKFIKEKLQYDITAYRAIELVMYSRGKKSNISNSM